MTRLRPKRTQKGPVLFLVLIYLHLSYCLDAENDNAPTVCCSNADGSNVEQPIEISGLDAKACAKHTAQFKYSEGTADGVSTGT